MSWRKYIEAFFRPRLHGRVISEVILFRRRTLLKLEWAGPPQNERRTRGPQGGSMPELELLLLIIVVYSRLTVPHG